MGIYAIKIILSVGWVGCLAPSAWRSDKSPKVYVLLCWPFPSKKWIAINNWFFTMVGVETWQNQKFVILYFGWILPEKVPHSIKIYQKAKNNFVLYKKKKHEVHQCQTHVTPISHPSFTYVRTIAHPCHTHFTHMLLQCPNKGLCFFSSSFSSKIGFDLLNN